VSTLDPATELDDADDPFAAFDRSAGIGVIDDPYPLFAAARAAGALHRQDVRAEVGLEVGADAAGRTGAPAVFTAYSHEAVQAVLRDGETFSSRGYAEVMGPVMGRTILEMDEPEHHTYRALVQQAFSRRAMERWEREVIRPVVDEHLDPIAGRGRAELMREVTFPFPVTVIARMMGLPAGDLEQFHRWAVEIISVGVDEARARRASRELAAYLAPIVERRRAAPPAPDLISTLAHAEADGRRLDDEEIFSFLRLLLPAGAETTYRSSSNLLFGLLTHPEQLATLRRDVDGLVSAAIEEGLRWEPPLLTILRIATRDTTVAGVEVPAGSMVVVNLGSANRDETVWEHPERFDILRRPRPHLAFATGPHTCLGMHLARLETRVLLERMLARLPDLRLDPEAPAPRITGMTFRAPTALPVRFD
jgi:cytochrome P450